VSQSQTNYFFSQAVDTVKALCDRAALGQKDSQLYSLLLSQLATPGSDLQRSLWATLDKNTNGQWQATGITEQTVVGIVRPWTQEAVAFTARMLNRQPVQPVQSPSFNMSNMAPVGGSMFGNTFGSAPQPQPTMQTFGQAGSQQAPSMSTTYELAKPPIFDLQRMSAADIDQPSNKLIQIGTCFTGEYEKTRLLAAEMSLHIAQNTADAAAAIIFDEAPQELIRGTFAHVVYYQKLFHIPGPHADFCSIADAIWPDYQRDQNWNAALTTLNRRLMSDYTVINKALTAVLNDLILRRIRPSSRDTPGIARIDGLEDLSAMIDRASEIPVTKHKNYWTVLNHIVKYAIEILFNPKNRIDPDDPNFGDFIHCNGVKYYAGGKSKFDYGTFDTKEIQVEFIKAMLQRSTVIRLPRAMVFTNAIDPQLIARVRAGARDSHVLLHEINTVGTSLLDKLHPLKTAELDVVVCTETSGIRTFTPVVIGRTLDDEVALIS
jgi:hypothetical protein